MISWFSSLTATSHSLVAIYLVVIPSNSVQSQKCISIPSDNFVLMALTKLIYDPHEFFILSEIEVTEMPFRLEVTYSLTAVATVGMY